MAYFKYLFPLAVVLGVAFIAWSLRKKKVDVPATTQIPNAGAKVPNASVVANVPAPTVIPGTNVPSNPFIDAYLHGGDGGNSAGVTHQSGSDPYGDHQGNVLFGDGGYVWFAQGVKIVTIKDVVPGQRIQVSTADGGYGSVKVDVTSPSGDLVASFTADAGADQRLFTATESGDYRITVDSKAVRGSVRMSRNS